MLKIAVCTKATEIYRKIKQICKTYSQENNTFVFVDRFSEIPILWDDIETGGNYDLLIIDTLDEDINSIYKFFKTANTVKLIGLVFITNENTDVLALSEHRPLGFINDISKNKIYDLIQEYYKLSNNNKTYMKVKSGFKNFFILFTDIIYISSNTRMLDIVTEKETYSCYGKLSDYENIEGFINIHKSILVNTNYIKSYNYKSIELKNGEILPISQSRRPYVRKFLKKNKI